MAKGLFSVERESKEGTPARSEGSSAIEGEADLPPIVARMVVEIRSDGTRTVARGALEDVERGEKVALTAQAKSPAALARELSKALLTLPGLAGAFSKEAMLDMLPEAVRDRSTGKFRLRPAKLGWPKKKKSQS